MPKPPREHLSNSQDEHYLPSGPYGKDENVLVNWKWRYGLNDEKTSNSRATSSPTSKSGSSQGAISSSAIVMQARESVLKDGNTSKASNRNQITNKKIEKDLYQMGGMILP